MAATKSIVRKTPGRTSKGRKQQAPPPQQRLAALRALACDLEPVYGWMGPLSGPAVDPRLMTTYCPSAMRRQEQEMELLAAGAGFLPEKRPEAPKGPEALGSSTARNSEQLPEPIGRYGLKGLTAQGKRSIKQGCCVLEEQRHRLAFWTVTLPDEAMAAIRAADNWDVFQEAIRHRLRLKLRRAGLPPQVVGVAEIHPKRSEREGVPFVHLHIVFVGRKTRWHRWEIDRWQLDAIIAAAAKAATGLRIGTETAGNVQPVKWSVTKYLAKYMSKDQNGAPVCVNQINGIPRQWWFWTRELKNQVDHHTIPLPYRFVRWIHAHRTALVELGLISHGQIDRLPPGSPPVFWLRWCGPPAAAAVLARWLEIGAPAPP
jgi:hypothetical protein